MMVRESGVYFEGVSQGPEVRKPTLGGLAASAPFAIFFISILLPASEIMPCHRAGSTFRLLLSGQWANSDHWGDCQTAFQDMLL